MSKIRGTGLRVDTLSWGREVPSTAKRPALVLALAVSLIGFWPAMAGAQSSGGGGIPEVLQALFEVQQQQQQSEEQAEEQQQTLNEMSLSQDEISTSIEQAKDELAELKEKLESLGIQGEAVADHIKNHPVSWNRRLPAVSRFVVLADFDLEATLDRETGLVWETFPDADEREWRNSWGYCYARVIGGRMGWRLPTAEELASLLEAFTGDVPRLPAGHPFLTVGDSTYWSSTTAAHDNVFAWVVDFGSATFDLVRKGTLADDPTLPAWCVRGGHGHDGR